MAAGMTGLDYIVIIAVLSISVAIGLYFRYKGKKKMTLKEYFLANGDMSILPVSFSLMATVLSAITLLGIPAETYLYGCQLFLFSLAIPVGTLFATYACIPVYFDTKVSTSFEYLHKRFGYTMRVVVSLLFTIQQILYLPVLIYAPSLALEAVMGLSVWASVISITIVCTIYCFLGGLRAVLWTDLIQAVLMYTTVAAIVIRAVTEHGGFTYIIKPSRETGRLSLKTSLDSTVRYSVWNVIIHGIFYGMYHFSSSQTLVQRILSVPNVKKAQRSLLLGLPLTVLFNLLCVFVGLIIYSYFRDCDPVKDPSNNINSADQLVPFIIMEMFDNLPGIPGLCIAGIFSAALSTASSVLNTIAAVTFEDLIQRCLPVNFKESSTIILAKSLVFFYGLLSVLLTVVIATNRGVVEAGYVIVGIIGAPTFGAFFLGMFTSTANEAGVLVGLLFGCSIHAIFGFGGLMSGVKYPSLFLTTFGCTDTNSLNNTQNVFENYGALWPTPYFENVTDVTKLTQERAKDVSTLFKMSYQWFAPISCSTTIMIGYITSFIISFFKKYPPIDPNTFSPLVRNWLDGTPKSERRDVQAKLMIQMELKTKISKGPSSKFHYANVPTTC